MSKVSPSAKEPPKEGKRVKTMDFGAALQAVVGQRVFVRRLDWKDKDVVIGFEGDDERLKIYLTEDRKFHPLIVSLGDVIGTDWVIAS